MMWQGREEKPYLLVGAIFVALLWKNGKKDSNVYDAVNYAAEIMRAVDQKWP